MKKPIGPDQFLEFTQLSYLAPVGDRSLCFYARKADLEGNCYHSRPLLLQEGQVRELPALLSEVSWFRWQDSDTCLICEEADGKSTISRFSLAGEEKTPLLTAAGSVTQAHPLPDGRWLLLRYENLRQLTGTPQENQEEPAYDVFEEFPFRYNGMGICDRDRSRLYLWDAGALTLVSPENMDIADVFLMGSQAFFYGDDFQYLRSPHYTCRTLDLHTLESRLIPMDASYSYTSVVKTDDTHVLCARSDGKLYGEFQNEYLDLVDIRDGSYQRINGDCEYHIYSSAVSDVMGNASRMCLLPYRNGVLFLRTVMERASVYFADFPSGEAVPFLPGEYNVGEAVLSGDGTTLFFLAEEGVAGPEIYAMDMATQAVTRLTHVNDAAIQEYDVAEPQVFFFPSTTGMDIQGFFLRPRNFDEKKVYKAVIYMHGGPNESFGVCYHHRLQYLASLGYAVFYCNNHGSCGRGAAFGSLHGGQYYTTDVQDILSLYDYIAALPYIDGKAVAISGGSYGGMLTNWIIGHTDVFKTAISDRGCGNELEDFFLSDCGVGFSYDQRGGSVWDEGVMEKVWDNSPIKYAPFVKTPTLFLHGAKDYRCSPEQSLAMFAALRLNGVKTKVCIFKDEHHGMAASGKPKNRIKRLEIIRDWLAETL